MFTHFFRRKLIDPLLSMLQQGILPEKLALTVALGSVVGLIPTLGVTTVVITALALRLRLNVAISVLISYLMQPLQLLLMVPFMKAGSYLSGLQTLEFSVGDLWAMVQQDWQAALGKLWLVHLLGLGVWLLVAFPLGFSIYRSTLPLFRKLAPAPAPVPEDLDEAA